MTAASTASAAFLARGFLSRATTDNQPGLDARYALPTGDSISLYKAED